MNETTNYKLHLTNDSSESFKNWREKMNGTEDSNMVKIDAALAEKANHSVAINVTLLADAWTGANAPFTQVVTVEGMTASQNGIIDVSHDSTALQREIARDAILSVVGQEDGLLTIAADGEMPTDDIPMYIILLD